MDITAKFRAVVRAIVGMPDDPGQPPHFDRLALYRAQVMTCASDGSTCDVQPEDARISPEKFVKVRVGIPSAQVVVQPGAVVLLGWERGDPARPYCMPAWEPGAVLVSLAIGSSPDNVVTKQDLTALIASLQAAKYTPGPGTPTVLDFSAVPLPTSYASNSIKVQR